MVTAGGGAEEIGGRDCPKDRGSDSEKCGGELSSDQIKIEVERRVEEGRRKLLEDVDAQLQREKEAALHEARRKQEQARREREELDKMLEEYMKSVEEAQKREALELQSKDEERYWELELIQRQKEEAARRKKMEEEEEHARLMKLSSKNKSREAMSLQRPLAAAQEMVGNLGELN